MAYKNYVVVRSTVKDKGYPTNQKSYKKGDKLANKAEKKHDPKIFKAIEKKLKTLPKGQLAAKHTKKGNIQINKSFVEKFPKEQQPRVKKSLIVHEKREHKEMQKEETTKQKLMKVSRAALREKYQTPEAKRPTIQKKLSKTEYSPEQIRNIIETKKLFPKQTVRSIAREKGVSKSVVGRILKNPEKEIRKSERREIKRQIDNKKIYGIRVKKTGAEVKKNLDKFIKKAQEFTEEGKQRMRIKFDDETGWQVISM